MMRIVTGFFLMTAAVATAMPPEQVEFFEKKVRPVLAEQCYKCHGVEKQKADLRLDSREALLKGADTGPVVVLGAPEKSSLIKSIRHEGDSPMPEKAPKMPDEQIAALAEWVKMGAPWPANDKPVAGSPADLVKKHWAFQPIKAPAVPQPANAVWAQSELDRFVLAELQKKGIAPSEIADRYTLIRRATFALTGLPPTVEEVEAFEKDPAPVREAFAKVVDRLLASPRYGERWGRHWLDVARYADHRGYLAGNDSREYPFAWTYRDWVIRSLNEDLPYDQFIVRQLAADLPGSGAEKEDLAALGFLTLGRRFLNNQHDIIDDRMDVTIRGTMALTVSCARCHDHKFDPVSAKDYYALYGVFASTDEEKDPGKLPELPGGKTTEAYEKLRDERLAEIRGYEQKVAKHIGAAWGLGLRVPVVVPPDAVESLAKKRQLTRKYRDERRRLEAKLAQVELNAGAPPRAHVLTDKPSPVTPRVFIRGNPGRPGDQVQRRFFAFLGGEAKPFKNGSGRLELAREIVSPQNPLTARVIVNRVWMHQFGFGLVRTPGDFGAKSELPTHPEMLDFLAAKFMREGWSLKKLQREIMLSSTWMQRSDLRPDGQKLDPENRLLWRQNRQRLNWEALHDSLLAAAGDLDEVMFGRPVQIFKAPFPKRRAIYGYIDRQNLPGTLRTFDFASPDMMNPQRASTSVPQQALYMLNSPFVMERAATLASQPEFASSAVEEAQVQEIYERVFSRRASPEETAAAIAYVKSASVEQRAEPEPLWRFGYGSYHGATQRMSFDPLPHWTGSAWQGGGKLPDKKLGWVFLDADGGHPGREHAAIRRFTAPRDMVLTLSGRVHRNAEVGNGVLARIVSSRQGQLAEWVIEPKQAVPPPISNIEVKAGETLDFVVESRGDENSDSFQWRTVLRATDGQEFGAQSGFRGPQDRAKPLTAWERYAQALLSTNEFAFVD
jgi:mono/diheme cytochrome c family protein/cytochrome c553